MHTLKILYFYYYLLRIILLLVAVIWKLPLLQGGSKSIGGYYRYLLFIISEDIRYRLKNSSKFKIGVGSV